MMGVRTRGADGAAHLLPEWGSARAESRHPAERQLDGTREVKSLGAQSRTRAVLSSDEIMGPIEVSAFVSFLHDFIVLGYEP